MAEEEASSKIVNSPFVLLPADIIEQINTRLKKIEDFIQVHTVQPAGKQPPHDIATRYLTEEAKQEAMVRIQREQGAWPAPKVGITAQGILKIARWARGDGLDVPCEFEADYHDVTVIVALEDYSNTLDGEYRTRNAYPLFFKPNSSNIAVIARNLVIPPDGSRYLLLSGYGGKPIHYAPGFVVEIGVIGVRIGRL